MRPWLSCMTHTLSIMGRARGQGSGLGAPSSKRDLTLTFTKFLPSYLSEQKQVLIAFKADTAEKKGAVFQCPVSFSDFLRLSLTQPVRSVMYDALRPHGLYPPGSSIHGIF
ncbi:unnamed protein product [Rangifer tarandus platyrhynchus]|uniref:Uncharacterized protein n=1 Tax=Rangifer tarandus platyrhynchus TaxID=3082113 RepID=A0AC59Z9T0_RANTA